MNRKILINHYRLGDIMIYFFINVLMYLIIIFFQIWYYRNKMNMISFMMILFNMNIYFVFIDRDINFLYGILVLISSVIISYFFSLFSKNNQEVILIKDGNINFRELVNSYSYYRLIRYLKIHHINLDEVSYCIKKNNNLVVIKNKDINFPISLIVDGKLISENLKLINKDKDWLNKELLSYNLLIKDIEYAYFRKNKIYFVNN